MDKQATIIFTGGTGLLGTAFLDTAPDQVEIIPTSFKNEEFRQFKRFSFQKVDITDRESVIDLFDRARPRVVVHAASLGSVDYCEQHREEAMMVNVEGTRNVIEAAQRYGTKMIFTSSNAVFDGNDAPYTEASKTNPVNFYGKTKVIGEDLVQRSNLHFTIVRLILMYGWNHPGERQNPVTWLIEKLTKGERVKLVNDTYTNPLLNTQAAQAIWKIVELDKTGILNISGGETANRYEFGIKTAEIFGLDSQLIEPVPSEYFSGIAARMPNTAYDTRLMEGELGVIPFALEEGLMRMKRFSAEF